MLKEFFGYGGYAREAEGFLSWQHLTFVTLLMVCMVTLAVMFGIRNRKKSPQARNRVLMVSAILMDSLELFKIVLLCAMKNDWLEWLHHLPLYLCSIQMITLPLAAFSRGRIKKAAIDFACIFGIIGALLGTYGAGQNYAAYPVLSIDNVVSGLTHGIAGFASLYILFTGMESMEKEAGRLGNQSAQPRRAFVSLRTQFGQFGVVHGEQRNFCAGKNRVQCNQKNLYENQESG